VLNDLDRILKVSWIADQPVDVVDDQAVKPLPVGRDPSLQITQRGLEDRTYHAIRDRASASRTRRRL
jgi:hypothetical protein